MVEIRFFGLSDAGLVRSNNEDAFIWDERHRTAALADGMGGAAKGELASRFFIEAVLDALVKKDEKDPEDWELFLRSSFDVANRRILDYARDNPADQGLGCTAELLRFSDRSFALGHVGDSRTYLYRSMELKLLTQDHSFVQELINKGEMSMEEARKHPMRHVILRALGESNGLAVDTMSGDIFPGDLFLLCSDGLTDMVDDHLIRNILSSPSQLEKRAQQLIDAAKASGGLDNVTVVLCDVAENVRKC